MGGWKEINGNKMKKKKRSPWIFSVCCFGTTCYVFMTSCRIRLSTLLSMERSLALEVWAYHICWDLSQWRISLRIIHLAVLRCICHQMKYYQVLKFYKNDIGTKKSLDGVWSAASLDRTDGRIKGRYHTYGWLMSLMWWYQSTSLGHSTRCDLETAISSSPKTDNAIVPGTKGLQINWKCHSPATGSMT